MQVQFILCTGKYSQTPIDLFHEHLWQCETHSCAWKVSIPETFKNTDGASVQNFSGQWDKNVWRRIVITRWSIFFRYQKLSGTPKVPLKKVFMGTEKLKNFLENPTLGFTQVFVPDKQAAQETLRNTGDFKYYKKTS